APTIAAGGPPISGPPASTPPAPTGLRAWLLPATAILALALAGIAMWKATHSQPEPPTTPPSAVATPPAAPSVSDLMKTALNAFEAKDFDLAARTADAVLARDAGNEAARQLRDRARSAEAKVTDGLKRAQIGRANV